MTPKSSSSHFFISVTVGVGTTTSDSWGIILSKAGVKIGNGVDDGTRNGVFFRAPDHAGSNGSDGNHGVGGGNSYLDTSSSTAGTAIVFKAGGVTQGGTMYINRCENNGNVAAIYGSNTSSSITVMEIED